MLVPRLQAATICSNTQRDLFFFLAIFQMLASNQAKPSQHNANCPTLQQPGVNTCTSALYIATSQALTTMHFYVHAVDTAGVAAVSWGH